MGLTHQTHRGGPRAARPGAPPRPDPGRPRARGARLHRSGRHVVKADANARSAQFATLWGGKGHWREAVGLVRIDSRLPDDSAAAEVMHRWEDSLRARLGPERVVATTSEPVDARDEPDRRQEIPLGDWSPTRCATARRLGSAPQRRDDPAGRRDPGGAGQQLSARVDLPVPRRDPGRHLPAHRRPPPGGARTRRGDEGLGKGRFLQVSGITSGTTRSAWRGTDHWPIPRAGGGAIPPTNTVSVAIPAYPACHGGDGYQVPEAGAPAPGRLAPRAVDLLIRYVNDSLGGRVAPATGG